jgi:putative membrane protein insertion efficiency factor
VTGHRATWPARALMMPVRGWRVISTGMAPRCRYYPSCSQYALEALGRHGARRGLWLAARRIARCHPWGGAGLDPVPVPNTRSTPSEAG